MRLRPAILVLSVALLLAGATPAVADLEDDLAEIRDRIEEIEQAVADAGSDRTELVTELVETRDELAVLVQELDGARADLQRARDIRESQRQVVADLDRQLELAARRLQASETTMVEARSEAEQLTRDRYVGTRRRGAASFVVTASSVTDVEATLTYLDRVASVSEEVLARFDALRAFQIEQRDRIAAQEEEAAAELVELRSVERELVAVRADVEARTEAVAAVVSRQERALADLDAELSRFDRELDQLAAEQDRIEDLISGESSGGGSAPGALVRPVPGQVTSAFGPRTHPILGTVRMHTGIDMSAPYGQAIRAAADGRVILAGGYGGYGNTVMIDHGGGMVTLYAHQSAIRVRYGDVVDAGQTIGESGSTGLATGPHLHFEVRIGGTPVDPLDYL